METFKIGICEPDDFSKMAIKELSKLGEVSVYDKKKDLKSFISDKNAIFVRLGYEINDELLSEANNLRYICSPTTGLNHIKTQSNRFNIVSLKGEYEFLETIRATPEHVFGLTISLLRNYAHAFLNKENRVFNRELYKGFEIFNNVIGVIGLGRVGKIIARYYNEFGAKVYYNDVTDKIIDNAIYCDSIEELISKSNIVVLAANYTKENEKMITSKHFELLKDKYFINAARGELVDEDSLLGYIKKGWFKGVAIDVIAEETNNSKFLEELIELTGSNNLIVTPHIGGATYSSMERTEEFIVQKLTNIVKKEN